MLKKLESVKTMDHITIVWNDAWFRNQVGGKLTSLRIGRPTVDGTAGPIVSAEEAPGFAAWPLLLLRFLAASACKEKR